MTIEIQRIRTERHPNETSFRLRNRPRVVIEVDVIPQNGKIILGRFCGIGLNRIEIYEDEIDGVLAKVKAKDAHEALVLATTLCKGYRTEWAQETRERRQILAKLKTDEEREEYIDLHSNLRPEMFVGIASGGKYRRGLGALDSVHVVARDEVTTATVPDYRKLSDKVRDEKWLIDPPATMENATERAAAVQAKVFAQVVLELQKQNQPRGK